MVGDQEDIGVPGCICCGECILSKAIHMLRPSVSHLPVKGVKQCTQMWIQVPWALISLHQKTSGFIVIELGGDW